MLTWKTLLFLSGRSRGAAGLDRMLLPLRGLILPWAGGGGGRGVQVPDPPPVTAGRAHAAFPFIRAELCSQMAGRGGPGGVLGTMKSSWGTEPASAWLVPFPSGVRGSGGVPEPARKGESVDPSGKRTLRRWGAVGGGRASQEAAAQARGPVPPPPPPLALLGKAPRQGACALPLHLVIFNELGLLCTEARCGQLLYKAALGRGEGSVHAGQRQDLAPGGGRGSPSRAAGPY